MPAINPNLRIWAKRSAWIGAAILVAIALLFNALWNSRPTLADLGWSAPPTTTATTQGVTATWLGVTTLLFDDGETQLLIDGFISRPTLADSLLGRSVSNDAAKINFVMNEFRMRRIAAIVPVHSHFDHAMDVGAIANRSSASILGSESTANIARGAGVPEDQIIVAVEDQAYEFGAFTIKLRSAPHAPLGWRGSVPIDGTIDEPVFMPQPIDAFRMGGAWSIIIEHPEGTALVQGSSGFDKYALQDVGADVAFISVALIETLGRDFNELFWQHTVTASGAKRVYPVHFDDFTKPFADVQLPPWFMNDSLETFGWLTQFRDRWDADTELYLPEFGKPIAIYAPTTDSADETSSLNSS